ncbi:AAA family ATPase [Deltaproteobacteria bacterium OttesenSCG-928-K17]|nr:AAA family ATPase [Deltaproteobacteria bacterium OttesenSCG-928-K17]
MDYISHFNLSDQPFKNTYDGRVFFRGRAVADVFAALRERDCPSLIHLKGPAKCGKTFVLKRLPVELRDGFKVVVVLNPHLTLAETLRQALTDLGHSHKFTPHTQEEELLGYYQNVVSDLLADGFMLLLAVDNADELTPEFLAELYGLMELESNWRGRVRLLLCGLPDVPWPVVPDIMLELKELDLKLLDAEETEEYVQFRLRAAGGASLFSRGAVRELWSGGHGSPELINQLAERGLIAAWSSGRKEVGPAQIKAAQASLDSPLSFDRNALDRVARGGRRPVVRPEHKSGGRLAPLVLIAFMAVSGALIFNYLYTEPPIDPGPGTVVLLDADDGDDEEDEETGPVTATPAGDDQVARTAGVVVPSIAMTPPQLLSLPQGGLVLVVDQDQSSGQLWQGGAREVGRKAEVATPKFKHSGLYLFGRPRTDEPLIFQYPPSRDLPLAEAKVLWPRVATLLPQNILPVMVAPGAEYIKPKNEAAGKTVGTLVKAWVQSQQYRFPDTMAELYAPSFQFFELGKAPRAVNRDDFRKALKSELATAGEINLAISEPIIMIDPANPNLAWAIFTLKYDSKLRNDMGLRVLIFEKTSGVLSQEGWPIVAELWLPEKSLQD